MLSERIKVLRKVLKLSQGQFAAALGTTRDVIANLERERSEPKKAFLDLICTIFNVNPEWLINGLDGDMFKPTEEPNEELDEAIRIFGKLTPPLRKYALQQIKGLLEVQNQDSKQE